MGRRSDHSREQIKEMALRAAADIVKAQGLQGLSARKIATAIGYTVGTLYLVFDNLDDLIVHLNAQTLDDMYRFMGESLQKSRKPETRIFQLGKAYIQFAEKNHHRWSAIFEHRLSGGEKMPSWFTDKVLRNFVFVEDALKPHAGHAGGKKLQLLSRALWGGVHGVCVLGFGGKINVAGADSIHVLADTLIKTFIRGLGDG